MSAPGNSSLSPDRTIHGHGLRMTDQRRAVYDVLMGDEFCGKLFGKAEKAASLGVAEPDDIAELACFLASPASAKMTGQAISVTGGISAI